MKKILFLGESNNLVGFLKESGYEVVTTTNKLSVSDFEQVDPFYVISYGYRHIIKEEVLKQYNIINLHISYLPYNRGADPNFWSFLDDTPKGVTIHFMDSGIDTGDIIFQRKVQFAPHENTLSATYNRLKKEIEDLFVCEWKNFEIKKYYRKPQDLLSGTHHNTKSLKELWDYFPNDWNTTIKEIKCLRERLVK